MSIVKSHSKDQLNLHTLTINQYSILHCMLVVWYNGQWWLRNITEMLYDQDDVKATFTHKCGPAPTFCWPHRENICWSQQKASSVVDICTITDRNYTICSDIESLMIKLQKNSTRCRHKLSKLVVISRTLNAFSAIAYWNSKI